MTSPRVISYSETTDMMQPDMEQLTVMTPEELIQVIEIHAERWNMPIPDICDKSKDELMEIIVKMAKEARESGI